MPQPLPYESGRIEQLEPDIMVAAPALQKNQYADSASADGLGFRQVQHDDMSIGLLGHCVTQLKRLVAADKSAFAFHHCHVTDLINMYVRHHSLRIRSAHGKSTKAAKTAGLCFVRDSPMANGRRESSIGQQEFPR